MGEWITTANGFIALLSALIGLIGTGVGAFFTIKNFIKTLKTKNFNEIWHLIETITDTAMKEAEASNQPGVDKKTMVINIVKASCKAADIDITLFLDQLDAYIDDSIKFVNDMTRQINATKPKNKNKNLINE